MLPTLIVAKVAGAVARRTGNGLLGDQAAIDILGDPSIQLIPIDRRLITLTAQHSASFPLKGSGAVYTALDEQLGLPLITWDAEQLTRAKKGFR